MRQRNKLGFILKNGCFVSTKTKVSNGLTGFDIDLIEDSVFSINFRTGTFYDIQEWFKIPFYLRWVAITFYRYLGKFGKKIYCKIFKIPISWIDKRNYKPSTYVEIQKLMNEEVKFKFCDEYCSSLNMNEFQQRNVRTGYSRFDDHYCEKYKQIIHHRGFHPKLVRLNICRENVERLFQKNKYRFISN